MFVYESIRLFAGGADFTTRNNKAEFAAESEEKDVTNFGSGGWKEVLGGIISTKLMGEGQWEAGDASKVDDQAWAAMGLTTAYTLVPDSVTAPVGTTAWLISAVESNYKILGQVGDVAPWSLSASGNWPSARGVIAHPPATARTATGSGTAQQLGVVSATQYLYATLHVLSVAGTGSPTITVKIQSDNDSGFASATDQITFTAATAIGGQVKRLIGPITDDWFRPQFTISGSSPSFLFLAAFAVQ
jgi:hypothetical protein